jgi:hypothetical protein
MFNKKTLIALIFALSCLVHNGLATAAPACKGPNKNDSGCAPAEEPPPEEEPAAAASAEVHNVTVDWFNQQLTIRGAGLSAAAFSVGGSGPLTPVSATDSAVEIPFDSALATEVDLAGSYQLKLDGVDALTVFFRESVVDPSAAGCPCETEWSTQLGTLWGPLNTDCVEVPGPGSNDAADIAGTVLSISGDPGSFPQFPIGASFYPGDPGASECRLVQLNADASSAELTRHRINETQQADCAVALKANICAP